MNQTLLLVFHDMRLGGIQRKILDIIKFHQQHHPNTKIVLCLRKREGIFLDSIPSNVTVFAPNFHTHRFNSSWFTLWLIPKIASIRPTQIVSFMDLGTVPTLLALQLLPQLHPQITIGEDILTSKYVYTESFPWLRKILIKWLYPQADTILVQTPVQKIDLEKMIYNSTPTRSIVSSPNWLPLDFPPKRITPQNKRNIDILFVGRIDDQKNLPLFLDIIYHVKKTYPKIKATIVGDGDRTQDIIKLIKKLKLQGTVTIVKSTLNTAAYYSQAKIFLLTSNYEGFPLTLIEAISSGCIPVVRNIPELSQFFTTNRSKIIFDSMTTAVKIINSIFKKTPSLDYLKPYNRLVVDNQHKYISDYVQYFSGPKSAS